MATHARGAGSRTATGPGMPGPYPGLAVGLLTLLTAAGTLGPVRAQPAPPPGPPAVLVLRGHSGRVYTVAFSADGKRLVSVGEDAHLRLWDAFTGKELLKVKAHNGNCYTAAFSPDGKRLATASGGQGTEARDQQAGELKVWDVANGKELLNLKGQQGSVYAAAFSPDGKVLASGGGDHTVRLWDAATGKEVRTLKGHTGNVYAVAFSPDGKRLASAGGNFFQEKQPGQIKLWDVAGGKEVVAFKQQPLTVYNVAFSADGRRLASAGRDHLVKVWDPATGQPVVTLSGHGDQAWCVAFSPDGFRLASACRDSSVNLWDLVAGKPITTLRGHSNEVYGVAFSPDGRRVASSGGDGTVRITDVTGLAGADPWAGGAPTKKDLEALWADLAEDPARADRAGWMGVAAPKQVVPFLDERLRPVALPGDARRIARLVKDLDANKYAVRERATVELEKLADLAGPELRKALRGEISLDARKRIEKLLDRLAGPVRDPQVLQTLRAVAVLRRIGTPAARRVLEKLARGAPGARTTQEAEAALARPTRR